MWYSTWLVNGWAITNGSDWAVIGWDSSIQDLCGSSDDVIFCWERKDDSELNNIIERLNRQNKCVQ